MGYLGSKDATGAYQAIIAAMPPHDTYIETHLGGASILRHKPPSALSYGIDIDAAAPGFKHRQENTFFVCRDAVDWLYKFDFATAGRALVYCDPPYVLATRTSGKRYRHDYTDADHERLLDCLQMLPCAVMVSGYPSALYAARLASWRSITFQVMTRGGPRTEQLWMNYDATGAFWASFAGRDYIDRQRIKRKAANWRRFYEAMPPGERLAVLAAMLEVHGKG